MESSSPAISNNIIAFNSSGIYKSGSSPTLKNNDVYNPAGYNYSGLTDPTGTNGNISADPKLVSVAYGNLHIQPDSPCRDAGYDAAVQPGWPDVDGQPRIQGSHVDIGADESDGTVWSFTPLVVRVRPSGNDANDGSSWALAKRTVQAGITTAAAVGGDVWVAEGTYEERIALKPYTYLYGGFAGTESARSERDWRTYIPILDGLWGGSVVTANAVGCALSGIDGFTICNGKASNGGGIYCYCSSPLISNNTIANNAATSNGGGIYCYSSSPAISNNVIRANSALYGGGIACPFSSSSLRVCNNTITQNNATYNGGGVYGFGSSPAVSNNIIAFNSSGIYNTGGSLTLRNNDVYNPAGYNYSGLSAGTGDISADPLFADEDYHLSLESPCLNAGFSQAPGLPSTDMDDQPRIQGGVADIGADEFQSVGTIQDAKAAPNNTPVDLPSEIVSAAFSGFFYVEADNRSHGVRVDKAGHTLGLGKRARVAGVIKTNSDGERYVQAAAADEAGTGSVRPLGITNLALGGGDAGLQMGVWDWRPRAIPGSDPITYERQLGKVEGLNNIGLLMTIWGQVSAVGADHFYVDDGSPIDDGNPNVKGIRVQGTYSGVVGDFVSVTGVSSCRMITGPNGPIPVALLRARPGDIVKLR